MNHPIPPAVRARRVHVRLSPHRHPYAEPVEILRGLSFDAPAGQVTAVVGSNGAGKTTALRTVIGAVPSRSGSVTVLGAETTGVEDALPPGVAIIPDGPLVPDSWSADDLARLQRAAVPGFDVRAFGRGLRAHRIDPGRPVRTLSRGQATWFSVAAAIAASPRLIIADEPLAHLDPLARRDLVDLLRDQVADGCSVLLTTHDLEGMDRFVDHLVVLDAGRTVLEGEVETLRDTYLQVTVVGAAATASLAAVAVGAEPTADGLSALVHADDAASLPAQAELRRPDLGDLVTAHLREARAAARGPRTAPAPGPTTTRRSTP